MRVADFILTNRPYFEDFITRNTYHSNAIEGSTLSYAETYAILFNDNSFQVTAQPREIYEAINHKYALNLVLHSLEQELNEKLIKEIAILINKNILDIDGYRTTQVFIRGSEHIPPPSAAIPQAMMYLVYNHNHTTYSSVFEKLAATHIAFEQTHPFPDGNGRTGRLLMNFDLLRADMPPVVITKENRAEYFELLSNADRQGLGALLELLCQSEKLRLAQFGYAADEDSFEIE